MMIEPTSHKLLQGGMTLTKHKGQVLKQMSFPNAQKQTKYIYDSKTKANEMTCLGFKIEKEMNNDFHE